MADGWKDDAVQLFLLGVMRGQFARDIAERIGRSRNAVIGKICRMRDRDTSICVVGVDFEAVAVGLHDDEVKMRALASLNVGRCRGEPAFTLSEVEKMVCHVGIDQLRKWTGP